LININASAKHRKNNSTLVKEEHYEEEGFEEEDQESHINIQNLIEK